MERKVSRIFWINYVFFCVFMVLFLEYTGQIELASMGPGEDLIFIAFLIICGLVMRHWFKSNPEEVKRIFKL